MFGLFTCAEVGWRLEVNPKSHPINHLEFDVIVGADGRRNTLPGRAEPSAQDSLLTLGCCCRKSFMLAEMFVREGFRRKEFRGKLAIAITANFKNRNTTAEAKVEEISGVAFIFNQRFFQELRQETGMKTSFLVRRSDTYTAKGHWCRARSSLGDQSLVL